ncbi:hypothetical protein C3F09_07130 [candidate division GN15 bacterium]|uniref:Diacylglycerol glucosyltransferase N-terminal domain-containing protein n=1 Tax=candidate division GN15 bacterium TaxID=2072418 RepID=A0A855X5G2_9BACT|nr:MAG: hypothetical protein C3F09_07130 [candidate division GN15 bacterium]
MNTAQGRITFLYLNIGRGHPFYLDGIIEAMVRRGEIGLVRQQQDVFEIARGLSAAAWRATRWLYRTAPSHPTIGSVYHWLRRTNDYNEDGAALSILGRDLRRQFAAGADPLIVSHPTLIGILRNRPVLIYQHGELAAPMESLVLGAELVFVPTSEQAEHFVHAGYRQEQVIITGLCIEPPLVKQAADSYQARLRRIQADSPLTGVYFSSGAEPKPHVQAIVQASLSSIKAGYRAIVFAQHGDRLATAILRACDKAKVPVHRVSANMAELPISYSIALVEHHSRREENALTARFLPNADFFVSPAHERTNWALGLGLPMFILEPCFGPFAPINRRILLEHDVAVDLAGESRVWSFGEKISSMRASGQLLHMSRRGWGKYPINGFDAIAALLAERYSS